MRTSTIALAIAAAISAPTSFAADTAAMPSDGKPCQQIAKACLEAGYTRESPDKKFWKGCMKPVIMGESVTGVTIDSNIVVQCRSDKIDEMKKDFEELQQAHNKAKSS